MSFEQRGRWGSLEVNTDEAFEMPIILPGDTRAKRDHDGKVAFISFMAWDSEPGRLVEQKLNRDLMRRSLERHLKNPGDFDADDLSEDETRDLQAERLAALCTGWHLVDQAGQVIGEPFTREAAFELFRNPRMAWLRKRAWVFVGNVQNFMSRSSTS
jgi:hypothetical protein